LRKAASVVPPPADRLQIAPETVQKNRRSRRQEGREPSPPDSDEDEEEDIDESEVSPVKIGPPKKKVQWSDQIDDSAKPKGLTPYVQVPPRPTVPLGSYGDKATNDDLDRDKRRPASTPLSGASEGKRVPAYRKQAPIEDKGLIESLVKDLIKVAVKPLSLQDIANLSSVGREYLRKLLTRRRIPAGDEPMLDELQLLAVTEGWNQLDRDRVVNICEAHLREEIGEDEYVKTKLNEQAWDEPPNDTVGALTLVHYLDIDLPRTQAQVADGHDPQVPKGAMWLPDPVEQYYSTAETKRKPILVARESQNLRCLYPEINNAGIEEALYDNGSQICSMEKSVATSLNIQWDPDVTVEMTSANKTKTQTLGLARNVPFKIGASTIYVQLHIIEGVAYKVLLGRPFEAITSMNIQNSPNGDQVLTLTDPNTGRRVSTPTFPKGKPPAYIQRAMEQQREQGFRNSRS
jgi:hypothetical protein